MKISKVDDSAIQVIQLYQRSETVQKDSDHSVNGNAVPQEKVNLSAAARDIQALKGAIAELPEIREKKVEDLKTRIDQGTYNISGEKIAEKIVGETIIDILG